MYNNDPTNTQNERGGFFRGLATKRMAGMLLAATVGFGSTTLALKSADSAESTQSRKEQYFHAQPGVTAEPSDAVKGPVQPDSNIYSPGRIHMSDGTSIAVPESTIDPSLSTIPVDQQAGMHEAINASQAQELQKSHDIHVG